MGSRAWRIGRRGGGGILPGWGAVAAFCAVLAAGLVLSALARAESLPGMPAEAGSAAPAVGPPILVGFDGEYSHPTSKVPMAIERGILTALDEINRAGGVLGGRPLRLIIRDNRAVPARVAANVEELAGMPDVVAVFCSKYSPNAMEAVRVAQEQGIILLNPWADQTGIVEHGLSPNYVFRLSMRDDWALHALVRSAETRGLKRLGALLPANSWGRSALLAVTEGMAKSSSRLIGVEWYNWGDRGLSGHYQRLLNAGADGVVLVADEREGSLLVREVASQPTDRRRPVLSHWGITGGGFDRLVGEELGKVDLTVVQTFSVASGPPDRVGPVLARAEALFGADWVRNMPAAAGFAHAYDLTHILARAIGLAGSANRGAVRDALERLPAYRGLVRDYDPPFTPERHEALGPEQVYLARFTSDGALEKLPP